MSAVPVRVAVVGMACRYPDADSPGRLWENVLAGRRAFRPIPRERLNTEDYLPRAAGADSFGVTHAALLDGFTFDRGTFGVAGSTFRATDTVHWLALDTAHRALLDANLPRGDGLPRGSTAVVLGNSLTGDRSRSLALRLRYPYVRRVLAGLLDERGMDRHAAAELLAELEKRFKAPFPEPDEDSLAGGLANTVAGRVSNHFDLHGGAFTVDGACASSLLAVADGCRMLATGEADAALVGGVDLSIDPFELIGFARTGALAKDDMLVYDQASQGFLPGEGCGVVVLMREHDARAAGLDVRAVLTGWGISTDGSGSITRPAAEGHLLAVRRAYAMAGYSPASVGYFEGHGTGTPVGDATELNALSSAHGTSTPPAVIGSVKANIGHTKAAAGIAGLVKTVEAVRHRVLPPATGVRQPRQQLTGAGRALRLAERPEAFPDGRAVRAGVSAMGFGGINTHIAVEAADGRAFDTTLLPLAARTRQDTELLLVEAADGPALDARCTHLAALADRISYAELTDLAAALARESDARGETGPGVRGAVVAATPRQAAARLRRLARLAASGADRTIDPAAGVWLGRRNRRPRITFLFPGQGSGGVGPAMRTRFDRAHREVTAIEGAGLRDGTDTRLAQPRVVCASLLALKVLDETGVRGNTAVGHSLGELTALHWAGCMDEDALLRMVDRRAALMGRVPQGEGAMAALAAGPEAAARWTSGTNCVPAGLNGPRQTVVAGPRADVAAVTRAAREAGVNVTALDVSHAFHSPQMACAAQALPAALAAEPVKAPQRPVVSTVTGRRIGPEADLAALLGQQLISPVRFSEAVQEVAASTDLFVEVGPGRALATITRDCADAVPVVSTATDSPLLRGLLEVMAAAYVLGSPLRPEKLFSDRFTRPFSLDAPPRFLANPCEEAPPGPLAEAPPSGEPVPTTPAPRATPPDDDPAGADAEPPSDALTALRVRIAERAELPAEAIGPGTRLLDELHLSSITVGHIVARAAADVGVEPPLDILSIATATVGDIAALLDGGSGASDDPCPTRVPGAGSWVRAYRVDWAPAPLPPYPPASDGSSSVAGTASWNVHSVPEDPVAGPLANTLAREAPTPGTLLCLPERATADIPGLLLTAADAVGHHGTLAVVQRGPVGGGFVKSLHLERPDVAVCLITLPGSSDQDLCSPPWLARVAAEIRATRKGFTEVRYRADGTRLTPALSLVRLPTAPWPGLRPDDVVLVTGGGKGISTECAGALVGDSGARIAVLGRTRVEDDSLLAENLARFGPRVSYFPADITDPEAVESAVRRVRSELGPVTVVLHGAGRNSPTSLEHLDEEEFEATGRPKLDGLRLLLHALDDHPPRLLLAFGSIIGRSGLRGEAHYAAANEWLAAYVDDYCRARPSCRGLTLEWSVWAGIGMGDRLGVLDSLTRQGISPVTVDDGLEILGRVLADDELRGPLVLASRTGTLPTLAHRGTTAPHGRFLERVLIDYPGVELVTEAELSLGADPYLADHVLDGEALLPGVIGMEAMAQTAAAVTGVWPVAALSDVRFLRPITVPERGTTAVRTAALVRADGSVAVVMRSQETDFAVDHFVATVHVGEATGPRARAAAPVAAPVGNATAARLVPARDLYGSLLFQSGRFQRVTGYRHIGAHACRAVIAPGDDKGWFGMFHVPALALPDPGARDAFLHAVQVCVPHRTLLPVSVGQVTVRPAAAPVGDLLLTAQETAHTGDAFTYRLTVTDGSGRIVEHWNDVVFRATGDRRHRPRHWPVPLLAPLLVRTAGTTEHGPRLRAVVEEGGVKRRGASQEALARLAGAGRPCVVRRADGRPGRTPDGWYLSASHGAGVTLAVAADGPVGCDIEAVVHRAEADWQRLLGTDGESLAAAVMEAGWPAGHARTAVWSVAEAVRKAGGGQADRAHLRTLRDDGGAEFAAGRFTAVAHMTTVGSAPDAAVPAVSAIARHERETHA
ncbi:SDR family NAD(P)-dependent oxidoreductase [Streptomyces sp. NPDC032161]|uniref:SDR family NAD(P)-dependent oxidoreductase n=1 Tax=unclassified Streptomyces TaxID=2593676 RepID=UPI0033F4BE61